MDVKIPALGESITSGILASWHVKDGDFVKKGQELYALETDKITSEGTAEADGVISLKAAEGDEVEIGQVVATLDTGAKAKDEKSGGDDKEIESDAKPKKDKADQPIADKDNNSVSPAVRRIAAETGVDPAEIKGSGKGGRVTKGDMLAAADKPSSAKSDEKPTEAPTHESKPAAASPASSSGAKTTRRKLSPLRKRIAERLVQSQREAAILTTFNEVDMQAVMDLRNRYKDAFLKQHGVKLGFMSFFIKAAVEALKAIPALNSRIDGDELVEHHTQDIGVAVGTDRGLLVPVIRDCDSLSFAGIEKAILDYAKRAKEGKIKIEDLEGGTFTISNGGTYGSMLSTPIINPPQSGILGLHNIKERPVALNGQVVIRPIMYLALSYDHRIIDGKEAVTFLVKVKDLIEDPSRLLLNL